MKPVDQTRFGMEEPLTEPPGNCWAACIASVLECDLGDVPCEASFWKPGMTHVQSWRPYEKAVQQWLMKRGMVLLQINCEAAFFAERDFEPICIVSGPSPRNPKFNHAVVGRGASMIHDPHPSRHGLLGNPNKEWSFEFFIPLNIAWFRYGRIIDYINEKPIDANVTKAIQTCLDIVERRSVSGESCAAAGEQG